MCAIGITVRDKMDELANLAKQIKDENLRKAIAQIASDTIDVAEEERDYAFEQGRQDGWSEGYDEGYENGREFYDDSSSEY